jgi:glycosyltransferase involved in cell wall biosynthesis
MMQTGIQHDSKVVKMKMTPTVSIITPVHNGAKWIPQLAPKILGQTMADFEWIIIDDGSTDGSLDLILELANNDERVRVLAPGRIGLVEALNLAVREARGDLIARQDVDDDSELNRLELQVEFMRVNPRTGVLGGYCELIHEGRKERFVRMPPTEHSALVRQLPVGIPLAHTIVMFRREAWEAAGGYKHVTCGEDLLLWIEMARQGWQLAALPVVLGSHMVHSKSYFFSNFSYFRMSRTMAYIQAVADHRLGLPTWMYAYPAARLCYALLPGSAKRFLRRRIMPEVDRLAPVLP